MRFDRLVPRFWHVRDLMLPVQPRPAPHDRKSGRHSAAVLLLLLGLGGEAEMIAVTRTLSRRGVKAVVDSTWNELYERRLISFPRDGVARLTDAGRSEAGRCARGGASKPRGGHETSPGG